MRKFFELLQTKGSLALIGLLIGLFCGFSVANGRFRVAQEKLAAAAVVTTSGRANDGNAMQQQTSQILAAAQAKPDDFEAQMEAADQFLQIRRAEGALPFLMQANKLKPEDPRPMAALATAHLLSGKYQDAVQWARASLKRKPADLGSKVVLMFALIESRQQLAEAEQILNEVEKLRPNDEILGDARRALAEAKTGGPSIAPAAPATGNRSTLDHGPAAAKPAVK
jgi:tetratricopeptide (TPR) repeat protein